MKPETEILRQEIERLKEENRSVIRESENLKRRVIRLERDKQYSAITAANIERVRDFNAKEKEIQHLYNQLLLSNCPDMIFVFDRQFTFLLGTESSSTFLHYSSHNDLIDQPIEHIFGRRFGADFLADCKARSTSVMEQGESMTYQWTLTDEKETVYLEITISPANNLEGDCMGIVIVLHDVTDLTLLKVAAEKSSVAKSTFLATMSHEMRTPMNAIIGMASIAKNSEDPQKVRYCMEQIDNASTHLLAVINDILDISKIESGKFTLAEDHFVLEEMLTRVINVQKFRIEEKQQQLSVNLAPAVPKYLYADEQRLSQVITNLLSNAVKFTGDQGEGRITLSLDVAGQKGSDICLEVSVRDNGIGVSDEQQLQLFQSFSQGDSGISRKFGGTGLGLVISKNIINMMGGDIWLTSTPDQGSTFTFRVWVKEGRPETADQEPETNAGEPDSTTGDFAGKRILLVEDVELNREIVIELLSGTGLTIESANDGIEAIEKFTARPDSYDLIFMDIHMPGMDGYEATARIRSMNMEKAGTIPIIAMTANVFQEDIEKCKAAGMNDHTGKPIDINDVYAKLKKYL